MRFSYSDADFITEKSLNTIAKSLATYRQEVSKVITTGSQKRPEYSLVHAKNPELQTLLSDLQKKYAKVKHVILVGIGGSSLGVEAVHGVLGSNKTLSVIDTISPYEMNRLLQTVTKTKSVKEIAVCVVSKSGGTAEVLVNAGILLDELHKHFGEAIYTQTILVGNPKTDLEKTAKRLKARFIAMPEIVGGRYSIGTEASLVPLALLGHDVDSFISGFLDATEPDLEEIVVGTAARIYQYMNKGYVHYNFFAFETRLELLGAWYRQLFAESLGKAIDTKKQPVKKGMLPTISTAVELHSIGQLYLSGFKGVYTDFVTFDDDTLDYKVPKQGLGKNFSRFTALEVATAIYGGVIGAYQDKQLPYRTTIFTDEIAYSLGLFMAMRMREVMYVADLLGVDAFNQPNVELYKTKTKAILGQ
jgi:glucose-6-phosphate isomerase